jgi:hypothetical protein
VYRYVEPCWTGLSGDIRLVSCSCSPSIMHFASHLLNGVGHASGLLRQFGAVGISAFRMRSRMMRFWSSVAGSFMNSNPWTGKFSCFMGFSTQSQAP